MKIHIGNLVIEKGDTRDFSKLKEVTGYLSINSNADLKALTTVGGYLSINSNADLKALTTVGGDLSINSNADLKALTTVGGDLSIYSNADLKALTTVGGYLSIYSNADLKALTTVGGYLYIYSNADLKALTTVGGYLSINSNADLKALTTVGGYLSINSNADLKALTTVGGDLYIYSNADLKALTTVGGYLSINSNADLNISFLKNKKWKAIDKKLFIIESEKTSKGVKIYSGYNLIGIEKNKPKKEQCFVAEKDGFTAHGVNVKDAVKDCLFKAIAEKIKKEPILKTTIIDINYYHTVTGSCVQGIKSWMNQHNVPEGLTAEKLLPILVKKQAYGVESLKKLISWTA